MAGAITGSILGEVFNWSQCFTIWGWSDWWREGWREMAGVLVEGRTRGEKRGRERDSQCSTGAELISFNTCTSSDIWIIIFVINAVYSVQVGRCVCVQMRIIAPCVHSRVPVGGWVIAWGSLCVYVCVCDDDSGVCLCWCWQTEQNPAHVLTTSRTAVMEQTNTQTQLWLLYEFLFFLWEQRVCGNSCYLDSRVEREKKESAIESTWVRKWDWSLWRCEGKRCRCWMGGLEGVFHVFGHYE